VRLTDPVVGSVIRYAYLWHSEYVAGSEEGRKDRPCALVAAIKSEAEDRPRVLVIPITHREPDHRNAIEIPRVIKERLGLDSVRSWIVLSEWNDFAWPGPDLRRVDENAAYGMLPVGFFARVQREFLKLVREGKARRVPRTE
jgi:hypothetical protein